MEQFIKLMPVSPSDELFQAFRAIYSKYPPVESKCMANTMVGGFYIDEAYLYEIK